MIRGDADNEMAWLREEIDRSLNDPRPNIPAEVVFANLRRRHANLAPGDADRSGRQAKSGRSHLRKAAHQPE
jgi:hypothetical protein